MPRAAGTGDQVADGLVAIGRRLEAIAHQGLAYATDEYDAIRYRDLAHLAEQLFAALAGREPAAIDRQLDEEGYATPKVDVRGAAFDELDRVLLVREISTGAWTLPGGWAEVGRSPRQAVQDEFAQEAGWHVDVTKLCALYDRRLHPHGEHRYHIYKAFFACRLVERVERDVLETDAVAFFPLDELPQLDTGRVTRHQLDRMHAHHLDPGLPTDLD